MLLISCNLVRYTNNVSVLLQMDMLIRRIRNTRMNESDRYLKRKFDVTAFTYPRGSGSRNLELNFPEVEIGK